jgi:NADPH-dependent curcumin reductase CurA
MPVNRVWHLEAYPEGNDFASAVKLRERPMPVIGDGELLVRNIYLSLDAGTRMWMTAREDSYSAPTPLGSPVIGFVIARVVESRHPGFKPGDLVRAYGQWADHSVLVPAHGDIWVLDESLSDIRQYAGVLGPNGWTAYVGLTEFGRMQPGETVLVSAAAGATGLLAAQIAKIAGSRVIGITGGPEKRRFLTEQVGLDASVDHRAGNVEAALREIAPDGIDVYFDNVGGPLLDAVLPNMALRGRIAVCGLVSTYGKESVGPARYDLVLMRRLTIAGFFSPDFYGRGEAINRLTRPWLEEGRIALPFDVTHGLENVLTAYAKLFTGGNIGKVLVELGE